MALGTIGSAIASSAISAGLSYGAQKLFGGNSGSATSGLSSFQTPGFSAGGLTAKPTAGGNIKVESDPLRRGLVNNISGLYGLQGGELAGMRESVAPGFSDLRAARLGEIEDARTRAIGNLRDNLARRRVLGSSFGQDTLSRAEAEFAGLREKTAAETFLQELELSNNLLQQQFTAQRSEFQTKLDEMNLQAEIAAKLTGGATTQLGANARLLAELNAKDAAGQGRFFGQTFQPAFADIGKGVASIFGGGGGGGGGGGAATGAYMMGSTPVPIIG